MSVTLLDKKGIASFLSISPRKVDQLALPYILVGSVKRFNPDEVLNFLKDSKNNGGKQ